jgi:DNA-binding response OmpR family regulator
MTQPLRIFVVENHADTLKYLTLYLEEGGHEVISASTLADALARFPTSGCNVLISDIGLPDGNGWELMERAGQAQEVFAIAMSGFGSFSDRSRSNAAGFRKHMRKPFDLDELDRVLAEAADEINS